jgi:two-component system invasion response regulator UvrY
MTIRIYLIDDHSLVRAGMKMILAGELDMDVVGDADNGDEALRQIRVLKPDVVLCDLHLPGMSGLEITERITRSDLTAKVIIVSVLEDCPLPRRLMEAGAAGYIGKAGDATELLSAVRLVSRGKRYLGASVAQNLALSNVGASGASPFDELSPRELEVAMLLTQGLRQEDIAQRLSLSAKTINTHKARLFQKVGIQDSISLARLAAQYGLLYPSRSL